MLRIVFMGSDPIALPALAALRNDARIAAVFTQPDRASGRGQKVRPNEIKRWALEHGVPVLQPEKLGVIERAALADLAPDLGLVMAYGHILKPDLIAVPVLGTLNLHASLLPKYRGASPIQTAIACGERETGVTLMRIVPRLDAGPIADAERVPIAPLDTAAEIEARLATACVPLLGRCLQGIREGTQVFREQEEAGASYCRRLVKEDGTVDFAESATVLAARINGLMPWPGCTVEMGGAPVRLGLAEALPGDAAAGVVTGADSEGLLVGTGKGTLRLRRLQRPGGRMLPATDFLRGHAVAAGTRLESRPMSSLISPVPFPRVTG